MRYDKGHSMYFLGIGGIGMSALARYYHRLGVKIYGYDRVETQLTKVLEGEGMLIHYTEDTNQIPDNINLVVYTPAIPDDHKELVYLKEKEYPLIKRANLLGKITRNNKTIAIAGTHGKTTITSMVTHILQAAGIEVCAFIGGIAKNFDSNFVCSSNPDFFIVEADEYDQSFLHLQPYIAVISSIEADHLDIYSSHSDLLDSYKEFSKKLENNGKLIVNNSISPDILQAEYKYGFDGNSLVKAKNIRIASGKYHFELQYRDESMESSLQIGGKHNIENALAAASVAISCGIDLATIAQSLESYKGVQRRFDIRFVSEQTIYIDDYAHHPTEIKACINAVKDLYHDRKISLIFQPHLYSRTADFMKEFAESLSLVDRLILMDIYPARELPIEGITSEKLLELTQVKDKFLVKKEELIEFLKKEKPEILITMGAGDIAHFVEPITKMLAG